MRIDLGPLLIDESGCQGLFRNSVHGEARINGRKDGLWKGVDCGENNIRDGLRLDFQGEGVFAAQATVSRVFGRRCRMGKR